MEAKGKILILTNSEYGLAIMHELLIRGYEVHVGSFTPLETRLREFLDEHKSAYPSWPSTMCQVQFPLACMELLYYT
jgi:hypothetical protein